MAEKRTREKVALIVFILLIAGAMLALVGYFLAARSLNVAANQVDDTLGMMDDYTVIIYPGTVHPATPTPAAAEEGQTPEAGEGEDVAEHAAETSVEGIEEALDADQETVGKPLTVADVFRQYSLKGASVLSLDDANPALYSTPKVFDVGGRSIGVYGIDRFQSKSRLAPVIDDLRTRGADLICVLAPRPSMVGAASLTSIILATDPDETSTNAPFGSPFVAWAVPQGDVGVIAISSSNVISSAVVEGDR